MKTLSNGANCYLTHSIIADLLFMVEKLFDSSKTSELNKIYSESMLDEIRESNRFLGEILTSFYFKGSEILEFMLVGDNYNDIEAYKKLVYDMEDAEFFHRLFGGHMDIDRIKAALKYDKELNELYKENSYICTSYLALKSLVLNRKLFLDQLFSCMQSLQTEEFAKEYMKSIDLAYNEFDYINNGLSVLEPLEFSQKLMGKTFRSRGPFNSFTFVPSGFINRRAIRFFEKQQILFYSLHRRQTTDRDILKVLKVISDDKRLQIIEVLSNSESIMGKDLAEKVGLSKATISHHIEQLRGIGFVNEERIKNSKYYSINTNSVDDFIDYITSKLKSKK